MRIFLPLFLGFAEWKVGVKQEKPLGPLVGWGREWDGHWLGGVRGCCQTPGLGR